MRQSQASLSLRWALLWRIRLISYLHGQVRTWPSNPSSRQHSLIALPIRLSSQPLRLSGSPHELGAPVNSSASPSQLSLAQSWAHSGPPGRHELTSSLWLPGSGPDSSWHFLSSPELGCKVMAGVNHLLHRNQGPGEPDGPQLPFWLSV